MRGETRGLVPWVSLALFAFPVLVWALWAWTPLGFWPAAYSALLLQLLPALALAQLPLVEEEENLPRIPVYLSSGATILILGWLGLVVGGRSLGEDGMGLTELPAGGVALWAVGLTGGTLALVGAFHLLRRIFGLQESRLLAQLLPETRGEKGVFAGLSLAAGIGEELAYRGFLVPTLVLILGSPWGSALLSSAAFGILHAYQGWLGVVRTTALGLLLAWSFLASGTLWPAILAHTALDLLAGLVLGKTLIRE